jgi:hypothetical protein
MVDALNVKNCGRQILQMNNNFQNRKIFKVKYPRKMKKRIFGTKRIRQKQARLIINSLRKNK